MNTLIDEILDTYYQDRTLDIIKRKTFFAKAGEKVEPAEWYTTAKAQLFELITKEIIGSDLPLDQPGDDDMDNITLQGHLIFRKGANWLKEEQRQKLSDLFGKEK